MYRAELVEAQTAMDQEGPAFATGVFTVEGDALRRYGLGETDALDDLVERYQRDAYWQAMRLVHDEQAAQDVVQEAFVRLLENRRHYDARRSFRAWFMQIVRNLAIDWLRRNRRETSRPAIVREVDDDPATGLAAAEREARVRTVLDSLPEKYRRLLEWRELRRMRADAIAERTGVGYDTTRWRIHRARKLFRREWERRYGAYRQ